MFLNKYGILIKKNLQEKYPKKYLELRENGNLHTLVYEKQVEITEYSTELFKKIKQTSNLYSKQRVLAVEHIHEKIQEIVKEISES